MVSEERIAALLSPYLGAGLGVEEGLTVREAAELYAPLAVYLELLLRWNARTNLTAIREPEEIVKRHFGESLFTAGVVRRWLRDGEQVLDFGSGAGFPGVPLQLLLPEVQVVLAESQGKKAAFLHEVVRSLGLRCAVWAGRVEAMPAERRFRAVMMRAVDRMEEMADMAKGRVERGGVLVRLTAGTEPTKGEVYRVPGSLDRYVMVDRIE